MYLKRGFNLIYPTACQQKLFWIKSSTMLVKRTWGRNYHQQTHNSTKQLFSSSISSSKKHANDYRKSKKRCLHRGFLSHRGAPVVIQIFMGFSTFWTINLGIRHDYGETTNRDQSLAHSDDQPQSTWISPPVLGQYIPNSPKVSMAMENPQELDDLW